LYIQPKERATAHSKDKVFIYPASTTIKISDFPYTYIYPHSKNGLKWLLCNFFDDELKYLTFYGSQNISATTYIVLKIRGMI